MTGIERLIYASVILIGAFKFLSGTHLSTSADRICCSVVACLGLHPWYAHEPGDVDWLPRLRQLLVQNPTAAVGEIGLDRQWVPPGCTGEHIQPQLHLQAHES